MLVDLHCHSTFSDGDLTPQELLHLALENAIEVLALTDHDSIDGAVILQDIAKDLPIKIISGIECSVTWQKQELHVVALGIDFLHPRLNWYLKEQQQKRFNRAKFISEKLQAIGFEKPFEEVSRLAVDGIISRTHFAHYLIDIGAVKDKQSAFKLYLGEHAPAYVSPNWLGLEDTIDLIHEIGGYAILAHPLHYRKSTAQLKALIRTFKENGGDAIEVVSGIQSPKDTQRLIQLASNYQLKTSVGSDFHRHQTYRANLGRQSIIPENYPTILDALLNISV